MGTIFERSQQNAVLLTVAQRHGVIAVGQKIPKAGMHRSAVFMKRLDDDVGAGGQSGSGIVFVKQPLALKDIVIHEECLERGRLT